MSKVNELLSSRFKKASKTLTKMTNLAEMSASGKLSGFSGIFRVVPLTEKEEEVLKELLNTYGKKDINILSDLKLLSALTSEVKAIHTQAVILHGERIKQAQEILKPYRDGAFSAWLVRTYGNRQTPYNFLQYYEFYMSMPRILQEKVDAMPRQAIYTLATRNCPKEEKEEIIRNYEGQSKKEILAFIRKRFPLSKKDKRTPNIGKKILQLLLQVETEISNTQYIFSSKQKKQIVVLLQSIQNKLMS